MEYITAEQFLEQPVEVQKVFIEWWKPKKGDIFQFLGDGTQREIGVLESTKEIRITDKGKGEYRIPLLTEGQLRKFIEDKTDTTMDFKINVWKYKPLVVEISLKDEKLDIGFKTYEGLLQAYWKVALEIAKESVEHES